MKITYAYMGKAKDFKPIELIEHEMALLMSKMMQLEREVRVGKEAELKLNECRDKLKELAKIYIKEE